MNPDTEWSTDSPLDVSAKLLMTLMRLNIVKHKDSLPITLALFRKYGANNENKRTK